MNEIATIGVKKVLTAAETAQYLGITIGSLYNLTSSNQIPHYKPRAKMLYFNREEIEAWLMKGKVKTVDEIEKEAISHIVNKPLKTRKPNPK